MDLTIKIVGLLLPLMAVAIAYQQHLWTRKFDTVQCLEKVIDNLERNRKSNGHYNLTNSYFYAATNSYVNTQLMSAIVYSKAPLEIITKCKFNTSSLKKINNKLNKKGSSYRPKGKLLSSVAYILLVATYIAAIALRLDNISIPITEFIKESLPHIVKEDVVSLASFIMIAASPFIGLALKRGLFYMDIKKALDDSDTYYKHNARKYCQPKKRRAISKKHYNRRDNKKLQKRLRCGAN